jgi:hypothetical protein
MSLRPSLFWAWLALAGCGSDAAATAPGPSDAGVTTPEASSPSDPAPQCTPPDCPIVILSRGEIAATELVVHGDTLYVAGTGGSETGIFTLSTNGGALALREALKVGTAVYDECHWLGADATHLYFTNANMLERLPFAGGPKETVGETPGACVVPGDADVFGVVGVGTGGGGPDEIRGIWKVPKAGGARSRVSAEYPQRGVLGVRDGTVYFAANSEVRSVPVTGGTVSTVAKPWSIANESMVLADGHVYGLSFTGGGLMRAPIGGGASEVISPPISDQSLLARGAAFYGVLSGVITKYEAGKELIKVTYPGAIEAMTVDDEYLYVADKDKQIRRIRR